MKNQRRFCSADYQEQELHIFCDTSLSVTAVVPCMSYGWRKLNLKFPSGQTRVAPLPEIKIPRSELQGALYEARIGATLICYLPFKFSKVFMWTNTIVLDWVRNTREKHKLFVANRFGEFLE